MNTHVASAIALERMVTAVEKVRECLHRATQALSQAKIPYAIVGGNAVAAWVKEVDEAAVRNARDVDILLRRSDWDQAREALVQAGFFSPPGGKPDAGKRHMNDAQHAWFHPHLEIFFVAEKVRAEYLLVTPDVDEMSVVAGVRVLALEPLVRMMLSSLRDEDRMLLRDLIDVGLVDRSWPARYPSELAQRLQLLLDTPEG
jgi:hypothetical protein